MFICGYYRKNSTKLLNSPYQWKNIRIVKTLVLMRVILQLDAGPDCNNSGPDCNYATASKFHNLLGRGHSGGDISTTTGQPVGTNNTKTRQRKLCEFFIKGSGRLRKN